MHYVHQFKQKLQRLHFQQIKINYYLLYKVICFVNLLTVAK